MSKTKLKAAFAEQTSNTLSATKKQPYVKKQDKTESKMKMLKKTVKRGSKKFTSRQFLTKFIIVISSLALIGTSVLPYIIR